MHAFPSYPNVLRGTDREVRVCVEDLRRPVHGGGEAGHFFLELVPLESVPILRRPEDFGGGAAEIAELDEALRVEEKVLYL